jgi:hypothetical protein
MPSPGRSSLPSLLQSMLSMLVQQLILPCCSSVDLRVMLSLPLPQLRSRET